MPDRIDVTARPFSSNAWKKTSLPAGTVKYALPSFSTGTVPSMARAMLMEDERGICKPVLCAVSIDPTDSGRTWQTRRAEIFVPSGHRRRL